MFSLCDYFVVCVVLLFVGYCFTVVLCLIVLLCFIWCLWCWINAAVGFHCLWFVGLFVTVFCGFV